MGRRKILSGVVPYEKPAGSRQSFIRLDLNENRGNLSPQVRRVLRRMPDAELAMYPESEPLRRELAGFHGLRPGNVLLANGGDQAIRWVFETFVEAGDPVVWAAPTFSIYPLSARLRQARIRAVPYAADLGFPLAKVLAALATRPSLLVLVSPNNPTGTVIADDALRGILERSGKTPVLLDEAYGFFSGLDHAAWIREFPNLIILNSFSKAFALAGMRLGYLLGAAGSLKEIEKVAPPFPLSAASIRAGRAALADVGHARCQARRLRREQHRLNGSLQKLGVPAVATAANFILARFDDAPGVWRKLRQAGILTKNLDREPLLAGTLRITVGSRKDNRLLLRVLADILPAQAVLFDMDGVLVDVRASCDRAILKTVAFFCGKKPAAGELLDLRLGGGCNNDWQAAAALLARRGCLVAFADIVGRFQEIYLGRSYDGLCRGEKWLLSVELLRKLKKRFALGIVTGRPRAEAQWTLARSGLERFFTVLVGAEDTAGKPKPHPRGIRLALKRLGVRRAVYVGDLVDDMAAAAAAGARAIAVLPGTGAHAAAARLRLQQAGAQKIIADVNEIMEVLDETGNDQP